MTTGYVWHELFGWAETGNGALMPADPAAGLQPLNHISHPDTKRRLHELVAVSGLIEQLIRIKPRHATRDEILRVHTKDYVARLEHENTLPKGGDAGDGMTAFGKGGYDLARLGAGGGIELVSAVVTGQIDNGYALIVPAGHHALADTGMGFCLLNNVAIAVTHARAELGVGKVAVVDWDVHHGNGTQSIFWDEPDVLTISLHQDGCFPPNSGHVHERGGNRAPGKAINVPLPPGTGDFGYAHAMERVIVPALHEFQPELIVVASGFDPNAMDPLARQFVSSRGFRMLTKQVLAAAAELCDGKVALLQEGGYSPMYVPFCGHATIETLADVHVLDDPYLPIVTGQTGHEMEPHQKAAIADIAAAVLGS